MAFGSAEQPSPASNRYASILKLATPTVIAMVSQSAVNEIDIIFFKHLPGSEATNAQAMLLPALLIVWLFGGSLGAISVGTQALTARRYAEKNFEAAGAVLANAAWFTLVAGALFTCLGQLLLPLLVATKSTNPEMAALMTDYSRWRIFGVVSMACTMAIKAFFDGVGRTYVHFVSAIVMNLFNVLFCYMFIFGHLGAPRMGAAGAGVAAFLATWIGLFIMLVYAWAVRDEFKPLRWAHLSRGLVWSMLKLSLPAAIAIVVMASGFNWFQGAAQHLDELAKEQNVAGAAVNAAAMTAVIGVLKLTLTACIGFGTATATFVGQSLGRKEPHEAARYGWASVRLGLVIFGVIGLCEGLLFTEPIVAFVCADDVRTTAMLPMRMVGVITPAIAVALILSEALFGAGATKFVAAAQLLLVFVVLVPGAYVGAHYLGMAGIWVAACVYGASAAMTMSAKFAGGAWKKIEL
jgi:putative MATE family efflux protein